MVFVGRVSGGLSRGADRQDFFIGGDNGWINRGFYENVFPIEDAEDYAFLTPVLPLRGFPFNVQSGTQFVLGNFELRFPLVRYFIFSTLPLGFQNILGATFVDVGTAWTDAQSWRFTTRAPNGEVQPGSLLMSTGAGLRAVFFGLPLRFDVAWRFEYDHFSKPVYLISLGPEL
jgi:outer membrane protein assembly factor BamA